MRNTRRALTGSSVHPGIERIDASSLSYQPVKLSLIMETRTKNNQTFLAPQHAAGLEPISPEIDFREGLIRDLFFEEGKETKCQFLIVVTMYNESAEHFSNTMIGVNENLNEFYNAGIDPKQVTCIMIVDGIKPFMETYTKQKDFFSQFFNEDMIKTSFKVSDVRDCKIPKQQEFDEFAHCFSQSVCFGSSPHPLNFIMCVKQFNKRKLNTHLWFFGGFCEMFQPTYVMLLDVGTKPLTGSLFYLYEALVCDGQLAGCCGEIKPMDYNIWKLVVPAQVVEYKFSHMLDKALESVIGYITVLPGAFSAYRWEALQGAPLWEDYFKSICHPELMDAFQSNIYLAEDRVLCLSLVSKRKCKYTLRYVKKSVAETDVPDSLAVLMAQRRRWINGSWFALVDALKRFKKIYQSDHNICRKILFTLQMLYYFMNVIYSWFMVGAFCLAFTVALRKNFASYSTGNGQIYGDIIILAYISILMMLFITSLGVKPKRVEDFYKILSAILGLFQFYIVMLMASFVINMDISYNAGLVQMVLGSTFASFGLIVILNCETWTILKGVAHYIFLIPTYVNIFLIYSICNVHDCTWGNRPDALNADEKERLEEFEEFRTRWAIIWALCNSGFAYGMGALDAQNDSLSFGFLAVLAGVGIAILILRVVGGVIYLLVEACKKEMKANVNVPMPEVRRRTPYRNQALSSPERHGEGSDNLNGSREEVAARLLNEASHFTVVESKQTSVTTVLNDQKSPKKEDESYEKERRRRKNKKRESERQRRKHRGEKVEEGRNEEGRNEEGKNEERKHGEGRIDKESLSNKDVEQDSFHKIEDKQGGENLNSLKDPPGLKMLADGGLRSKGLTKDFDEISKMVDRENGSLNK